MAQASDRRRAPRVEMAVACLLMRRAGSPIECETVDVGTGGMSVCSERPLADDELLAFEMEPVDLSGRARVLRQRGHQVYALRFEQLPDTARDGLERLVNEFALGARRDLRGDLSSVVEGGGGGDAGAEAGAGR